MEVDTAALCLTIKETAKEPSIIKTEATMKANGKIMQ